MGDNGVFYTLIKPQFEAGREKVGKNGVVRDPDVHQEVIQNIITFTEQMGWHTVNLDYSPITGPKGNIEFLAEIRKNGAEGREISREKIQAVVKEAHERMMRL